jgi:two-component system sensor histidine kinase UhpB
MPDSAATHGPHTSHAPRHPAALNEMSLFARIFISNVAVMAVAGVVLLVSPATVSPEPQIREIVTIVGGLGAIVVIDLILLRHAFGPLRRLTSTMQGVEPLRPGRRVPEYGGDAEIVELTRAFNDMLDRLESERQDSVRNTLAAQEGERHRVAQELHDEVGQSLTAVMLLLERLARDVPEELREDLVDARETARASLEEVRAISSRLRPEALEDLGLRSALSALTARFNHLPGGATIERDLDQTPADLPPETELVVYRIVQEGLTNAVRHAAASRIRLSASDGAEGLTMSVVDDGVGLGQSAPGTGIQGMRERAMMVGAELALTSPPGGGTELRLRVPRAAGASP